MAKYTKPELRARLKEEIKTSDKGGKPGQWSARKSQLLVQRYESEGGGYTGERDQRQKSLSKWGDEQWRTKDGSKSGGSNRYLPDAAWDLLTKEERKATDQRKRGAKGQYEANTTAAKEARKALKLIDRKAAPARDKVGKADSRSLLTRARKAEKQGKARKTVLAAIDARRKQL